jgi:low temperature requirement protein LtrA
MSASFGLRDRQGKAMAGRHMAPHMLRSRDGHEHNKATFVELFFDLVFVFAVTQLSHTLLEHFTVDGIIETTLLLMAVWWVWIYTTWVTNWLDPDKTPVRVMLFALMLRAWCCPRRSRTRSAVAH